MGPEQILSGLMARQETLRLLCAGAARGGRLPLSDLSSESLCAGGRCLYVYGELAGAPQQMPVRVPSRRGHRRRVLGIISGRSLPAIAQRTTFINYSGVAAQQRAEKVSLRTDGCRLSVLMERRLEVDRDYNAVALSDDNRYLLNVSPRICLCQNERFPSKSAFEARPPTVYLIHRTQRINMKAGGL
ncbi:hypothetical protein QQF64_029291 [Cirrhinus molitorella]|uniref:Uncharacterized protein n=1 Tax=Cirrhinus molitorella TaxID=172907 RepID=A0ABR3N995_9TELE